VQRAQREIEVTQVRKACRAWLALRVQLAWLALPEYRGQPEPQA
jgi:hypothetical protein